MEYWIWLSQALGPANPRINDIFACYHTAQNFYEEKKNNFRNVDFLNETERDKLNGISLSDAKAILEKTMQNGYDVITPEHERYPDRLRNIYAMPAVLYVDGTIDNLDQELSIAVVGSRKCSDYGRSVASDLGRDLALMGALVVTGLARGIDGAAHKAAIDAGGKTIAVLGCGLDIVYPPEHDALRKLIPQRGAVITEFPLGSRPEGFHFPLRNRIMSGVSLGVVVVEGKAGSGSLITADYALNQGKDVFAVPGSIYNSLSRAPFQLIRSGAVPISCANDILEEYRYQYGDKIRWSTATRADFKKSDPAVASKSGSSPQKKSEHSVTKRPLPDDTDDLVRQVYQALSATPLFVDEIAAIAKKNPSEVLTALSELEIIGFVSATAGGRYFVC